MLGFYKRTKSDPKDELYSLLGEHELPSFSVTIMNALNLLRDPESSISEIAEQVQIDPGLHINVLKTVNSVAFGFASKISSISHAVSLLGRSRLESIVLSAAVKDALPRVEVRGFDSKRFWKISKRRASLARALASRFHPATETESFTVGLLQDMAVPVILAVKKNEYCSILEKHNNSTEASLDILETETFGFDHATIGAFMAEQWELPQQLVNAIGSHHKTGANENVYPAVRIVSCLRYDEDSESLPDLIKQSKIELDLDENKIMEIIEQAFADAEELSF